MRQQAWNEQAAIIAGNQVGGPSRIRQGSHPALTLPPVFGTNGRSITWRPAADSRMLVRAMWCISHDASCIAQPTENSRTSVTPPETRTVSPGVLTLSAL